MESHLKNTLEQHLDTLAALTDEARAAGEYGDATSAEVNTARSFEAKNRLTPTTHPRK